MKWYRGRGRRGRDADGGISVVICTLNRRDLLARVLHGLDRQTRRDFEVIVVNGPSTDGTAEMLAERQGRERVLRCDVAMVGIARNIGVAAAASPIVAFLDDDAIPEPTWLAQLVGPFDDERVGAVGGPVFDVPLGRIDWRICTCDRLGQPDTDSAPPIDRYTHPGADPFAYLAGCNMAFRRSVLREIGGFNPLLPNAYDDVEVCVRAIDRGHRIAYSEGALVTHHRGPSAVRDEVQRLRDPYPVAYARTLFALQCERSPHSDADVEVEMRRWMAWWREQYSGTAEDEAAFFERFVSGIEAACRHRGTERTFVDLGESPRRAFVRYLGVD